jgi:hypothetical protein
VKAYKASQHGQRRIGSAFIGIHQKVGLGTMPNPAIRITLKVDDFDEFACANPPASLAVSTT